MATELANNLLSGYGYVIREQDKRRVPREEKKTPEIKTLWDRSQEICRLMAQGLKGTEVAELLNITPQTVSNTINSGLGEEKLSEIRGERDEEAKKRCAHINELTNLAINTYFEAFGEQGKLELTLKDRIEVAKDVMHEFSGLRVPTKIQSAHVSMTPSDIESFKERGIKAAREAGLVIDITPSPSSNENH
jgi:predicted transcriptional regulator